MRFIDEGQGPPIVMVHGTPTWSFLYRHLVKGLRDRYRCVVPDHLGFGLSDKPRAFSYRPADQAANLAKLVDSLRLKDITLVVHDFGGPIGLSYAIDHPENVGRLVIFNTWMWSFRGDRRRELVGRLLGSALGRLLYRFGFSVQRLWRDAIADRGRYTPAVHRQYVAALASPVARHATWVYARELLGSSEWYDALWARRERLARIPALVVWGMKDPAFGDLLPRWRAALPCAEVIELPDTGHAPPEERAPEILPALREFLAKERPA
jgi:haloalkane dehalogenase